MRAALGIRRDDVLFWAVVLAGEGMALLVLLRSTMLGLAFIAALGVLACLSLVLGTRRGTLLVGAALVAIAIVLPGDLSLQYRIPLGGGGIFIDDIFLALVVTSAALTLLGERQFTMVRSPVTLPLALFLGWVVTGAVIGYLAGNDFKLILQDLRSLSYYVLFFWALVFVRTREQLTFIMKLLGVSLVAVFLLGSLYSALGRGMQLEFVETGVSRFPAPDDVFLIASILLMTFVVLWPADRPRPAFLWLLLGVALLGLILSFVRGNWVAFGVGVVYLLIIVRTGERARLIATLLVAAALLAGGLALVRPALLDSVVTRALAITNSSDPNVQYRLIENRAASEQIADHPVIGNGLGKDYLFDFSRYGVKPITKSYIHNNYYWFTQRLGFIGLGLFLWTMAAFLLPWMRYRSLLDRRDPWLTGLVIGSRAMVVVLLAVSVTSPRLNSRTSIVIAAVVIGMAEVALSMARARQERI